MNIKSSICGIQHTCINFLIFLIITKKECWPVFKQDPCEQNMACVSGKCGNAPGVFICPYSLAVIR